MQVKCAKSNVREKRYFRWMNFFSDLYGNLGLHPALTFELKNVMYITHTHSGLCLLIEKSQRISGIDGMV